MPGCDGEVRRERAVQDSLGWPIGIPSVGDRTARLKSLTKLVVDFWFNLLDAGSIPAISTNLPNIESLRAEVRIGVAAG